MLYRSVRHTWGAPKSMTKDEYFKLHVSTALVQEHVYTWVIASLVLLLDDPQIWLTGTVFLKVDEFIHTYRQHI